MRGGKSNGVISEKLFLHLQRQSTVTCNPIDDIVHPQLKEKNKNDRVDSDSKMNEDAKTSPDKVSTAAIKTNTSDRNDRNVKRNQAKQREKYRKYPTTGTQPNQMSRRKKKPKRENRKGKTNGKRNTTIDITK